MFKIVFLVVVSLLFISCSMQKVNVVKPSEKAFADEDTYILFALRAEQIKDYKSASELFEVLYKKADKDEYLYRSLEDEILAKENEKVIKKIDAISSENSLNPKLLRLKIIALVGLNKLEDASSLGRYLASETKATNDYLLVSDIYIKRKEFDLALKYLESAYEKDKSEEILDKMSIILYVNLDRKKEAIAHLETHSRMLGCSKLVCSRLIAFYSNDNNIDGLLSTYLRLYALNKDESVARKIIQLYAYKKDYFKMMEFLEKSRSDDEVLLQLYSSSKNYAKAYPLANELYKKTSEIDYLGQSAIFEYESAKDKSAKKLLKSVVDKLEKVTKKDDELLYMNYLGYILIDHDIDVKRGMLYINKVLKKQPNSAYYLDSQAWGYYKLGECKRAKSVIDRVVKLKGGDDPEVLEHFKKIEHCLKNNKGK